MKRTSTTGAGAGIELADVLEGYLEALESGTAPSREELLAAHPEFAESLGACLDSLEFIRRTAGIGAELVPDTAAPDESAPATGTLGDFRILREIGRGGMGGVYEAEQISLGRRVALKVLPFAAVLDPKQLQRFKNEAQAAALLDHNHVVSVYAVGCDRGVHYYAMQYIEGLSGAELIRELRAEARLEGSTGASAPSDSSSLVLDAITGGRSVESREYCLAVARLGRQAAEALDHAHAQGVVHRDIKPANLLIDTRGNIWVTDFGLASSRGDSGLSVTGDLMGTVRYMSPEQTRPERFPIDHRSDIYSLGVTLLELLTLEDAVSGGDIQRAIQEIREKDLAPARRRNTAVPADLETVLVKATAKDRDERYATAAELADDLGSFLEDRPIRARRPTLLGKLARWTRRHRASVAVAAVVTLLFVIGLSISTALLQSAYRSEGRARERAEANFEKAREAVDVMLTEVGERDLSHVPHMQTVRRRLLERAREFYGGFLRQSGHDPEVRHEAAHAHARLADIHVLLGEHAEAEKSYRDALDLLEELRATEGDIARILRNVAYVRRRMSWILANSRRAEEAERCYGEALEVAKDLVDRFPDFTAGRFELACVWNELGVLHLRRGDLEGAQRHFRASRLILERLPREHPDAHSHLKGLAGVLGNLAVIQSRLGILQEAESTLSRARELFRELADTAPDEPRHRFRLAMVQNNLGNIYAKGGAGGESQGMDRSDEAESAFRDATAIAEELARDFPGIERYRRATVMWNHNLALFLTERGDHGGALHAWRAAVGTAPDDAFAHLQLVWCLANCEGDSHRDVREALDSAESAVRLRPEDWGCVNGLGVALYRAGDWERAAKAFERAAELGADLPPEYCQGRPISGANAFVWFFLAMSRWQQGAQEPARDWFARAAGWMEQNRPNDRVLGRLQREASRLLGIE